MISSCLLFGAAYYKDLPGRNVSEDVMKSFNEKFPHAQKVQWEQCDRVFNARFSQYGKRKEASFLFTGTLVRYSD